MCTHAFDIQKPDVIKNPLSLLPTEITIVVCENLDSDNGDPEETRKCQATFAALALTCRHLHPFATRFLYSRYFATHEMPGRGFLQQLYTKENYMYKLEEIHVTGKKCGDSPPTIEIESARMIKREFRGLPTALWRGWLRLLKHKPSEAELGLLISRHRRSLRSLTLLDRSDRSSRESGERSFIWMDYILALAFQA